MQPSSCARMLGNRERLQKCSLLLLLVAKLLSCLGAGFGKVCNSTLPLNYFKVKLEYRFFFKV